MTRRKTHEEFAKEIYDLVGNEYSICEGEEYQTTNTKIKIIHNKCNHVHLIRPNKFLSGRRCPKCSGKLRKDTEYYKLEVHDLVGNEYSVLGEYKDTKTKIQMKHNKCNHVYEVNPSAFLRGIGCPKCFGTPKKTTKQFKKEVYDLVKDEYKVLGTYTTALKRIKIRHETCKHEYHVKPNNFLSGYRCPLCSDKNNSKGIKIIKECLDRKSVYYKTEEKFPNCKNKNELPFDVYLKKNNLIVEFDGKQHFESVSHFGGMEEFLIRNTNDQIKNTYCIENSIPLIRIPYWEQDNIEYILDHVLGYFNIIHKHNVDDSLAHKYLVNHPDWSHEEYISEAPCNKKKLAVS